MQTGARMSRPGLCGGRAGERSPTAALCLPLVRAVSAPGTPGLVSATLSGLSDRLGFKLWEFTYKPQFANSNIPIVAELVKQRLDSSKRLLSYYP
jgi:hypothetical protein